AALELLDHAQAEGRGPSTVDDPVVERDRDVADGPHDDLPVADDRALGHAADREDRRLGMVHERSLEEAGELAGARDREGRAAELLRRERPSPSTLREALDVRGQLLDRARVAVADDGHDETLLRLDGDA